MKKIIEYFKIKLCRDKWFLEARDDMRHFEEMAYLCHFNHNDKKDFWEYIISYSQNKTGRT